MSDFALRRTIRRSTAVLLIPLSMAMMMPAARLTEDGTVITNPLLVAAQPVGYLLLAAACLYLVWSVRQQWSSDSSDSTTVENT